MITGSPVSRLGAKVALCLPRRIVATCVARRPSVAPSASTTRHARCTSLAFGAYVFISASLVRFFALPLSSFTVLDADQAEPLRWSAGTRLRPVPRSEDLRESIDADLAATDPQERPADPAHHAAEERVGLDLETEQLARLAPLGPPHGPLARHARRERREIVAPDERTARVLHRRDVERSGKPVLLPPFARIAGSRPPDPVFVCASRRREPRVKVLARCLDIRDRDVLRKKGVYPSLDRLSVQRARRPEVDNLSRRVHSGIGAARAGDPDRLRADLRDRPLDLPLHRPRVRLDLESRVVGPVVRDARAPVLRLGR